MNRGEEAASREKPSLVYVRYKDHVEFRNTDPSLLKPCIREVVGWLVGEKDEALLLLCEKSVEPLSFERPPKLSFAILKSDVLEIRRIKTENC